LLADEGKFKKIAPKNGAIKIYIFLKNLCQGLFQLGFVRNTELPAAFSAAA
jgi:hypothetical protein